jgi:multidrug transporter EmrE-like cation transporter
MTYFHLTLAILFEVGWALTMKLSQGFTRHTYTAATIVMYLLSVVFLALATRKMDIGTGYAIWAGSGAALIAIAGMTCFKEPVSALKIVSLLLIVAGIAGIQLARGSAAAH